ncbi:MAG: ATP-binding protein [Pyrinomonadaceae bacterium]
MAIIKLSQQRYREPAEPGQASGRGEEAAARIVRRGGGQARRAPSRRQLQSLLDAYPSAAAILDATGVILCVNEEWQGRGNGRDRAGTNRAVGSSYSDVCREFAAERPGDPPDVIEGVRRVLRGEQSEFHAESSCHDPAAACWFRVHARACEWFQGPGGRHVVVTHEDVTRERRGEETIHDLSGRLLNAQEEERSRIARELHDDTNQRLALLGIELEQLDQELLASAEACHRRIRELTARAQELSASVHGLSYRLHPSKLDHLGLVAAVRTLCDEISARYKLQIEFTHHGIPGGLPPDVSLCLYRVAQEALGNAVKHSGARSARVGLAGRAGDILLRVDDAGAGFEVGSAKGRSGLGLISMGERLRLVGGGLTVESQPSLGTRIEARVPLFPRTSISRNPSPRPEGRGPEGARHGVSHEKSAHPAG